MCSIVMDNLGSFTPNEERLTLIMSDLKCDERTKLFALCRDYLIRSEINFNENNLESELLILIKTGSELSSKLKANLNVNDPEISIAERSYFIRLHSKVIRSVAKLIAHQSKLLKKHRSKDR